MMMSPVICLQIRKTGCAYRNVLVYKQHMQWAIDDFNLSSPPSSDLKKAEQEVNKDPVLKYIEDVHRGNFVFLHCKADNPLWKSERSALYTPDQIQKPYIEVSSWRLTKEIFSHFKVYVQQNCVNNDFVNRRATSGGAGNLGSFGKKLANLAEDYGDILEVKSTNKGNSYKFKFDHRAIAEHMEQFNENRVREIMLDKGDMDMYNEEVAQYRVRKAIMNHPHEKAFYVMLYRKDDIQYKVAEAFANKDEARQRVRFERAQLRAGEQVELWNREKWDTIDVA